jgi:hypothetical protein
MPFFSRRKSRYSYKFTQKKEKTLVNSQEISNSAEPFDVHLEFDLIRKEG